MVSPKFNFEYSPVKHLSKEPCNYPILDLFSSLNDYCIQDTEDK